MIFISRLAAVLLACGQGVVLKAADPAAHSPWILPHGVTHQHLERTVPRKLSIHVLQIDLGAKGIRTEVAAGPDPDGKGGADATLVIPDRLATGRGMIAAINTNAWGMLPDARGRNPGYTSGGKADVLGWVLENGKPRSVRQAGYPSCWLDGDGRCRIGSFAKDAAGRSEPKSPRWAVSGFRIILQRGGVCVKADNVLHPRTAIGTSADGKRMTWLVVDGRQPGHSLGVSEEELGRLLLEQGCSEGMNLDGGGSTVLLLTHRNKGLVPVNRPSGFTGMRPVPVILGLVPVPEGAAGKP